MYNYEVKFLSYDESLQLKNVDFKTFKYETKKKVEESVYYEGKRIFCERNGGLWHASRPRQIRQLESKLKDRSVIFCDWSPENLVTIVFSSGAVAYLTIKPETLDVTQILFDSYCVGKLSGQTVTGVVMCKDYLVFTHPDRIATIIYLGKNTNSNFPCRITDRDPHLQTLELGGGARKAECKVSHCEYSSGVYLLVWSADTAEPAPWSPALEDLANLHLYHLRGQHVTLVAYHQLENETLAADLSYKSDNIIHIAEQVVSYKSGVTLDWLRYEAPNTEDTVTKLSSVSVSATHITLPAPARVVRRSPCDSRLLAACIDGSLHVVHHITGLMYSTRVGFIATELRWAGELIVAGEEAGRLQCFDRALSPLHHHAKCIDLSTHLRDARRMQQLASKNLKNGPLILTSFAGGPLTLLRITHPRLLTAWIRSGRTSTAVALLRALDWEVEGTECLWAVNRLVCAALRGGLQGGGGEAAAQAALGAFLAPVVPHGAQAQRFAPPVHDLARKFFHHLLRRGRLEKAMSLAVDLADWDLFADARWAAERRGLHALADEAASLAAHCALDNGRESECSRSCSQCSSNSHSDAESSVSSEAIKTKPPPLPHLPPPQNPTIMPVPITQAEPASTNSIRPNLHQYLERDNTIWNTAVREEPKTTCNGYNDRIKPVLNIQNVKWHSVDNVFSTKQRLKQGLSTINESISLSSHSIQVIPRSREERPPHFKHLYQTELREDLPNTLYRYQNFHPGPSVNDRTYRPDCELSKRPDNRLLGEKNKVKFSDTVTVAVMPEGLGRACPEPAQELADSLPLCAPHRYLAAFAPSTAAATAPATAGTALDYVEV